MSHQPRIKRHLGVRLVVYESVALPLVGRSARVRFPVHGL